MINPGQGRKMYQEKKRTECFFSVSCPSTYSSGDYFIDHWYCVCVVWYESKKVVEGCGQLNIYILYRKEHLFFTKAQKNT